MMVPKPLTLINANTDHPSMENKKVKILGKINFYDVMSPNEREKY
jgi:hypothetical protein